LTIGDPPAAAARRIRPTGGHPAADWHG
jgi:hypothetical protein